ncbi:flagellar export chaperone FliS [candidate division KSB1 bacterium]
MQNLKTNAFSKYLKARIESASPLGLIVLMYEAAIKFLKLAREDFMDNDIESACDHLIRTQNIIRELQKALDMNVKELSPQLYALYDFMIRQLIQANVKRKIEPIDTVLGMLEELKEAWDTISGKAEARPVGTEINVGGGFSISG